MIKTLFFPLIRINFHCRHLTYLLCFARVRVEWVDSEHCSQRWVPQVVQYTTAKWLSFSSQQTDNSRSRSKNVGEKLAGSKLFPAFCSEACNRSINSINAKFFFKSQTPFGPRKEVHSNHDSFYKFQFLYFPSNINSTFEFQ